MGRKSYYSQSYKYEAVAKAEASGSVSQTAHKLGISSKTLHAWIKQYGEPLAVKTAGVKQLAARVRQLERQLALHEGQIEVLKKPSGSSARPRGTVHDDPAGTAGHHGKCADTTGCKTGYREMSGKEAGKPLRDCGRTFQQHCRSRSRLK